MKRMRADLIAEIKTARDEAKVKTNAYENIATKRYDFWRAFSAVLAYNTALAMFEQGAEHQIPDMAVRAIADFEHERDNDATEMDLAFADGRRDALASVADWMTTKENNR